MKNKNNGPKILILDIETAPILASVWKIWDENVGLNQINSDWHLLSFGAKWLNEKRVIYEDQSKTRPIENDRGLLKSVHGLLNTADIVVAHHGKKFDLPKLNARFITNGFEPPAPYKIVDTREVAARVFGFTSNKLEFLSSVLCTKKKLSHREFGGFMLWKECLAGNPKAWAEMRRYNIRDVEALEELYLKFRPWQQVGSPNFGVFKDDEVKSCPKCGSENILKNGFTCLAVGKYQRYKCGDCGAWARSGQLWNTPEKRKSLLR